MAQDQPQWWQKNRRRVITIGILGGCLCAIVLIILVSLVYGTGLGENIITSVAKATKGTEPATITITEQHQPGKTLWDWMQLLIIPVVLALAALLFNSATTRSEQKITAQRYQHDQEIAADKQREDLLQTYLDRMSELLLNKDLRKSDPKGEVRYLARARTLTVLSRLDAHRKKSVLQFLHESDLINAKTGSIVQLEGADLSDADLSGTDLGGANLGDANLSGADLGGARLSGADLRGAQLSRANLRGANLNHANLSGAQLSHANLSYAILSGAQLNDANLNHANLRCAQLRDADLRGAQLRDADLSVVPPIITDLSGADLRGVSLKDADLRGAYLKDANLVGANLRGANLSFVPPIKTDFSFTAEIITNLSGANLSGANLSGANLSGADLRGATIDGASITQEQLDTVKFKPTDTV